MSQRDSRDEDLDSIEREAERGRAELAGTLEALRGRVTGDGRSRRGSGGFMTGGVRGRIEANPLQTVAIGAAAAYPLVRIVTKIPAPILLLGAGVALAGRGRSKSDERVDVVVEEVIAEPAAGGATGGDARAPADVRQPRVSAVATGDAGGATRPGSGVPPRGPSISRAVEASRAGSESLTAAIRRNPLVAGGASLVVGAALAAMLPRSRAEGRLFGEASEEVRGRARELAATGARAGRRALEAAADEAERQDLTPEGARRAARDAAERVQDAVRDAAGEARGAAEGSGGGAGSGGSDERTS